jgi:hypothetical protein
VDNVGAPTFKEPLEVFFCARSNDVFVNVEFRSNGAHVRTIWRLNVGRNGAFVRMNMALRDKHSFVLLRCITMGA